jgi:hypothetical protein
MTSYFHEGFFGFIFGEGFTLSYFDEGFIFSLKNEGFTPDFIFWRRFLWFRILTKTSNSYFIFCRRFSYFSFFSLKMKASLLILYFTNVSLASYFDKGFTLWLRILMKVSFFSKNEGFTTNFVFWWRFLWLRILMKASHFDFVFRWRFYFFFENQRLHTWFRILIKVSLASYFDEGFTLWLRISMKVSFFSLKNEGLTTNFVFWWMVLWLCILTKVSHFDFVLMNIYLFSFFS